MPEEDLIKYQEKVFCFLDNIPYGSDYYVIDDLCKSETIKLFIETIKSYMRMYQNDFMGNIVFAYDYSKFYKAHKIIKE